MKYYEDALKLLGTSRTNDNLSDATKAITKATESDGCVIYLHSQTDSGQVDVLTGYNLAIPHTPMSVNVDYLPKNSEKEIPALGYLYLTDQQITLHHDSIIQPKCSAYLAEFIVDQLGRTIGQIAIFRHQGHYCDTVIPLFRLMAQKLSNEIKHLDSAPEYKIHAHMIAETPQLISYVDKRYIYRVVAKGYEQFFDKRVDQIVGLSVAELHGERIFNEEIKPSLDKCLGGETVHNRHWVETPSGPRYVDATQTPFKDLRGQIHGVIINAHDITDLKNYQEKLHDLVVKDYLTTAYNRRFFIEHLEKVIKHHQRTPSFGALFYLDLNNFKHINDHYGHTTGDHVLKHLVAELTQRLRTDDVIARLGGDEFAVYCHLTPDMTTQKEQLAKLTHKIERAISVPFHFSEHELILSSAIGVAVVDEKITSAEQALNLADISMYKNKAEQKGE